MRAGVISASEMFKENRMDPGFHLTKQSLVQDGSLDRARQTVADLVEADALANANPGALIASMQPKFAGPLLVGLLADDPAVAEKVDAAVLMLDHTDEVAKYFGDIQSKAPSERRGSMTKTSLPGTGASSKDWTVGLGILTRSPYAAAVKAISSLFDEALSRTFWVEVGPKEVTHEAKAYEILMTLDPVVRKRAAKDLARGSHEFTSQIEAAIREYPYMALALAFRDEEADLQLKRQAEDLLARAQKISGIGDAIRKAKP